LYEAMNFAALRKLPLIFACENNLYATHMPIRECRVNASIYKVAEPFGIETREVDGNDVLKVFAAGAEAVERCRRGQGPVFLEFRTYRFRGHVGPDDNVQGSHTDIRPPEELEVWLQRDPILIFEEYLKKDHSLQEEYFIKIKREISQEVAEAHAYAKSSPYPVERELEKYVFA
jgi:acetoin:2,6-dichlorophenolindophenol oxidoreductase subunit alpha